MPTDKALAVMTKEHLRLATQQWRLAEDAFRHFDRDAPASRIAKDAADTLRQYADLHRDIESVVRYLVDHPERLAGEGQVIVDREELKKSVEMLRDSPVSRYGNARLTLILAWMEGWLAGSPTAQESKEK